MNYRKVSLEENLIETGSADIKQSFYIAVTLYELASSTPGYKPLYEEC